MKYKTPFDQHLKKDLDFSKNITTFVTRNKEIEFVKS